MDHDMFLCLDQTNISPDTQSIEDSSKVLLASNTPKKRSGRKKFQETRHPIYRGIRRRNSNKWVCEVREPIKNSRIWLGTFPTAEMAARANDVAVIALRGRNACLNFADSAWRLPLPASSDVKDIQRAATKAAEAFRPRASLDGLTLVASLEESSDEYDDQELYMDEEVVFGMPGFINNMAQGMLLSPPQCVQSDDYCCEYADYDNTDVVNAAHDLWSYSF